MPLNPVVLGLLLVEKVGPTDPLGIAGYMAMGAPIVTWTLANLQAVPGMNIPLIAAGAVIGGEGGFSAGSTAPLKTALAAAIGISDAAGLEKLGIVTQHYADTLVQFGKIDPSGLIAFTGPPPPPIGPVTGTGGLILDGEFRFFEALEVTDAPGIEKWTAFGEALKEHLESSALITPAGMQNPAVGGAVIGTGTVS